MASGVATRGDKGGRVPPLTTKNVPKIGKKGEKEEKSGRKGKNREGSFTLTDRAGSGEGTQLFFGGCVPRGFQSVGSRERIFPENGGLGNENLQKCGSKELELWQKKKKKKKIG